MPKRRNHGNATEPPAKKRKLSREELKAKVSKFIDKRVSVYADFWEMFHLNEGSTGFTPSRDQKEAWMKEVFENHTVTQSNILRHKFLAKLTLHFLEELRLLFQMKPEIFKYMVEEMLVATYDANPNKLGSESPIFVLSSLHTDAAIKAWFKQYVPDLAFDNKAEFTAMIADVRARVKQRKADLSYKHLQTKMNGSPAPHPTEVDLAFMNRREDYRPMRDVSSGASEDMQVDDTDDEDDSIAPPPPMTNRRPRVCSLQGLPSRGMTAFPAADLMAMPPKCDGDTINPDQKYRQIRLVSSGSEGTTADDEKDDADDDASTQTEESDVSVSPPVNVCTKLILPPPPPSSARYMGSQAFVPPVGGTGMRTGLGYTPGFATNTCSFPLPLPSPLGAGPLGGNGVGLENDGACSEHDSDVPVPEVPPMDLDL